MVRISINSNVLSYGALLPWKQGCHPRHAAYGCETERGTIVGQPNLWRKVKGPIANVMATAWRISWGFVEYDKMISDIGQKFNLRLDAPDAVKAAVLDIKRDTFQGERWPQGERGIPALSGAK